MAIATNNRLEGQRKMNIICAAGYSKKYWRSTKVYRLIKLAPSIYTFIYASCGCDLLNIPTKYEKAEL